MCEKCDHASGFITGAIVGAVAGAILGVLFAPAEGEETRRKLKQTSEDLIEKGKIETAEARAKLMELKRKAEPYVYEAKDRVEDFIEANEPKFRAAKETAQDMAEDIMEQAKPVFNKTKKEVEEFAENTGDAIGDSFKDTKNKIFKKFKGL